MSPDEILDAVERSLRTYFEAEPARASVSFLGVEPVSVLRFADADGGVSYVSLGASRRPMSGAEEDVLNESGPRAEILIQSRTDVEDLWRQLAVLASAPVVEGLVFLPGASVDLGSALTSGSRCTGVIVTESELASVPLDIGEVQVLRLLPATANELAWARIHGTSALLERWLVQGVDQRDLLRDSADLT